MSPRHWPVNGPLGIKGRAFCKSWKPCRPPKNPVEGDFLLPVQYVSREGEGTGNQPRTFWGRVAHGKVRANDAIKVFPSGQSAVVKEVATGRRSRRRSGGRTIGRGGPRSSARYLARRLDWQPPRHFASTAVYRHVGLACSTPSQLSLAASTGCDMATAGCKPESPASTRVSISTLLNQPTPTSWVSMKLAKSWSKTQQPLPVEAYGTSPSRRCVDRRRSNQQPHERRIVGQCSGQLVDLL